MLSPQWLDELRSRITLSSVIMRTAKLTRAGREWKACCPFHDEKTPSFTVSDEKGFYHCFGCGAHGDVIRWMTDQRGLSFMDAVKELAEEAGMEVPRPDPREAERAERRASLHDVMAAAQEWFKSNLFSHQSQKAPPKPQCSRILWTPGEPCQPLNAASHQYHNMITLWVNATRIRPKIRTCFILPPPVARD